MSTGFVPAVKQEETPYRLSTMKQDMNLPDEKAQTRIRGMSLDRNFSETIEVDSRGVREIRGYDRRVELFAPLVPVALPTGPGADINDPLGDPVVGGLGRAPVPGDGLGRRSRPGPGVGRAGTSQERGLGRTNTLPGS